MWGAESSWMAKGKVGHELLRRPTKPNMGRRIEITRLPSYSHPPLLRSIMDHSEPWQALGRSPTISLIDRVVFPWRPRRTILACTLASSPNGDWITLIWPRHLSGRCQGGMDEKKLVSFPESIFIAWSFGDRGSCGPWAS